jgi:hypothetical protein
MIENGSISGGVSSGGRLKAALLVNEIVWDE